MPSELYMSFFCVMFQKLYSYSHLIQNICIEQTIWIVGVWVGVRLRHRIEKYFKRRIFSMSRNTRSKPMTSLSMNFSNMAAVKERCSFCSTMNI